MGSESTQRERALTMMSEPAYEALVTECHARSHMIEEWLTVFEQEPDKVLYFERRAGQVDHEEPDIDIGEAFL